MTSHPKSASRWTARAALAAGLLLAAAAPVRAQTHLDNPFAGARMYVNPEYTAHADATAAATSDADLAAAMRNVARQPTGVWLERIAQVPSVAAHLDAALAQESDLVLFVLGNLPARSCRDLYSNAELHLDGGLARYKAEFIDPIAAIARDPRYAGLRIVFVVEPDTIANLITGGGAGPLCAQVATSGVYTQGIQYAVNALHPIPNVYLYLDLAHAAWLGWDMNATAMVTFLGSLAGGFTDGKSAVDGFATNTGFYNPLREPFLTGAQVIAGVPVYSAKFYEYNRMVDEASYGADLYARLTAAGWPATIGIVLDTSRNGWGGPTRPNRASSAVNVDQYVNESRVDRRAHRNLWCNVAGSGLGEVPQAAPSGWASAHYDAFFWVHAPGFSDGVTHPRNPSCDPEYTTEFGVKTGALPGAPLAGEWFPAFFTQLVQNRFPAMSEDPAFYEIRVSVSGGGGGQIVSSPAGIDCPTNCNERFEVGTVVTLSATAPPGAVFRGWSPPCETSSPVCVFTVSADQLVTAQIETIFAPLYPLTVTRAGAGTGVVRSTSVGIDCGVTCTATFREGTQLTLTASAASDSTFTGWSGACTGATVTCVVPMVQAQAVTATFALLPTYPLTVTRSGTGTGTVISTPDAIQCGTTCSASFGGDAVVTLTAVAAAGSTWSGWGGACSGSTYTCTLTMTEARQVTATFMSGLPRLTVVKRGTGSGTVTTSPAGITCGTTCSATFGLGALVTLNVAPSQGSRLVSVTGCTDGGSCTGPVEMTKDRTVTVVLEADPATGPCENAITFSWNTGNFGTTGPVCYRTSQAVRGWGCSNLAGRTLRLNASSAATACGAGPSPLPKHTDGYTYFSVTAGQYPWASIYVW